MSDDRKEYEDGRKKLEDGASKAIVIMVDGKRFYSGISPKGRMQTAWSLAGAKLFGEWRDKEIFEAQLQVCKRGKTPQRMVVRIEEKQ